jgi:hypothetical protein
VVRGAGVNLPALIINKNEDQAGFVAGFGATASTISRGRTAKSPGVRPGLSEYQVGAARGRRL